MNYKEAIEYLYNLGESKINLRLENIKYLLERLDNPHKKLRCIHVAGTNGKGSVCAMISSILQNDGYSIGLYTSPHLERFEERIKINNRMISKEDLVRYLNKIKPVIDEMRRDIGEPTFFEAITSMAFLYFADRNVDFAVVEVGMGGRLDATNVVMPLISVITNIYIDHTKHLGNTIEEIALEKASIIKDNGIVVTAVKDTLPLNIIKSKCLEKNCKLFLVGRDTRFLKLYSDIYGTEFDFYGIYSIYRSLLVPLVGEHQLINATTAITVIELLRDYGFRISRDAIGEGLLSVKWPGRFEIIRRKPFVVIDGAHNPSGMKQLKRTITELFIYKGLIKRLILIIAISAHKDMEKMISEIVEIVDTGIITKLKERRFIEPERILKEFIKYEKYAVIKESIPEAIEYAISMGKEDDLICITGSLYAVAEARTFLKDDKNDEIKNN